MYLFDGLLNPTQDLLLLYLSLQAPSRTCVTQKAILRPPSFTPPPVTHPQSILHLPPLPVPWASSLVSALHTHFSLSVSTLPHTSSPLAPSAPTAFLFRHLPKTSPSCPTFASFAHQLYSTASPIYQHHNRSVLHLLRRRWGIGALHRVAVHTKLAFLTPLLRVLQQELAAVSRHYISLPLAIRDQCHANPATPGRASNFTIIPRNSSGPRKKRVAITVKGKWIKDFTKYILDGVVLEARLVNAVASLLETKYGIRVCCERDREVRVWRRGMLMSLSNRGTALLDIREPDGRGECGGVVGECVGEYLWRRYGVKWQLISVELVKMAKVIVEKEERKKIPAVIARLRNAIDLAQKIKAELIKSALVYEVGGARLSKICAFQIAEGEMCREVEEALVEWGEEYREGVKDARETLERLRDGGVVGTVGDAV